MKKLANLLLSSCVARVEQSHTRLFLLLFAPKRTEQADTEDLRRGVGTGLTQIQTMSTALSLTIHFTRQDDSVPCNHLVQELEGEHLRYLQARQYRRTLRVSTFLHLLATHSTQYQSKVMQTYYRSTLLRTSTKSPPLGLGAEGTVHHLQLYIY